MQRSLVLAVVAAALVTSAPLGRAQMPMKGMEMKGAARPYAGQQSREIKALSPEEIAISISAEMVAVRRNAQSAQHKKLQREIREAADVGAKASQ